MNKKNSLWRIKKGTVMNYLGGRAIEVSETRPLHFDKLSDHTSTSSVTTLQEPRN